MESYSYLTSPNKLQRKALLDQVEAILRELAGEIGPIPVAPSAITSRLGTYTLLECTCGHPDICEDDYHWKNLGQRSYKAEDIRTALLALEKAGRAEKIVPDYRSGRPHYWRYINNDPIDVEDLF
ncbi:MAG TPA: hypothetical protein PJ993_02405 [Candidatus Saccharibacteria bacterium]|nr:hypothetical protein [Candidatus Saccharibacteria bacterium]HMT39756.1 hypothetical protein [Candidatus Saccharibacteria bacterium]